MTVETGVGGFFCAAHRDARGRLHGHTWEVRAWFPEGRDAIELQKLLTATLRVVDHRELAEEMSSGEALLRVFSINMRDAVEIEISRPAERIYARYRRTIDGTVSRA